MSFNTPEEIAKEIFSTNAKNENTYSIIADSNDNNDPYFTFEILLTILLEGFDILSEGLNTIDSNNITKQHFIGMNPWFNSLNYNIDVLSIEKSNIKKYDDYYCKIIIKNKSHKMFFDYKNIKKNYHFFINGKNINTETEFENISAIFINDNTVYKIKFTHNDPSIPKNQSSDL